MNKQLKAIYDEDQNDRNPNGKDFKKGTSDRDMDRRIKVEKLITRKQLLTGEDYYHAAMIFQHGNSPDDFLKAKDLAEKAAELGEKRGLWLYAAATDRYLTNTSQPYQKYGTQYRKDKDSDSWYLYPVDPETTDELRARYNVPTMEEILRYEEELNKADSI